MRLAHCLRCHRALIASWLFLFLLGCAPFGFGEEIKAPNVRSGTICLVHDSKSWVVAKFLCYIQVTEVDFLRDDAGNMLSKPIPRMEMRDSVPCEQDRLYARMDVCMKSFATRQEAESFAAKGEFGKDEWVRNVIRDPGQLTLLSGKGRGNERRK